MKGIIEDVKGKAKEVIGIVSGHDGLREEGRAHQDKAEAERDVAKKEAETDAARAAEQAAEARQRPRSSRTPPHDYPWLFPQTGALLGRDLVKAGQRKWRPGDRKPTV